MEKEDNKHELNKKLSKDNDLITTAYTNIDKSLVTQITGKSQYYYNIGQEMLNQSTVDGQAPTLLMFNKGIYKAGHRQPPHSHKYLEIFYFLSGNCEVRFGEKTVNVKPNTVVVLNSEVIHSPLASENEDVEFFSLLLDNINISFLSPNSLSENPYEIKKFESNDNKIYRLLTQMIEELNDDKEGCYIALKGLVYQLFTEVLRLSNKVSPVKHKYNEIALKIKTYIDSNYVKDFNVDFLADMVFVNKFYLIHIFKRTYNVSPMQYLTAVRMQKAQTLLRSTNIPVTEISQSCGYDNPVYFSEQFKKTVGTTPSIYRKISMMQQ